LRGKNLSPVAPDDERRDLQARQGGLDRQQVAGVQGRQNAVVLAGRLFGAEQRFQPRARDVRGQVGDVLVAGAVHALAALRDIA
jgi:tRNA G37 N-methylase TrmD